MTMETEMARKFGIEVEFLVPENVRGEDVARKLTAEGIPTVWAGYTHSVTSSWKIVRDGSLVTHGYTGLELVSPPLEFGEEAFALIRKACEVINSTNASVRKVCGLHVHVDASDITIDAARVLAKRYAHFESTIDSFMPLSRRNNNNRYCQSVVDALDPYQTEIEHILGTSRYHKVNFMSFVRYRTIEFRHHSGTTNAEKIINWVKFCVSFYERSKNLAEAIAVAPSITINLPFWIRHVSYANRITPEQAFNMMNSKNHRKINNMLRAVKYILDFHERLRDLSPEARVYKIARNLSNKTRKEYVVTLAEDIRRLTFGEIDILDRNNFPTFEKFQQVYSTLEFWKMTYSPNHGYLRSVVSFTSSVPYDPANDDVFAGMDNSVATFYRERAMELAA